jgi:hypothetical protein
MLKIVGCFFLFVYGSGFSSNIQNVPTVYQINEEKVCELFGFTASNKSKEDVVTYLNEIVPGKNDLGVKTAEMAETIRKANSVEEITRAMKNGTFSPLGLIVLCRFLPEVWQTSVGTAFCWLGDFGSQQLEVSRATAQILAKDFCEVVVRGYDELILTPQGEGPPLVKDLVTTVDTFRLLNPECDPSGILLRLVFPCRFKCLPKKEEKQGNFATVEAIWNQAFSTAGGDKTSKKELTQISELLTSRQAKRRDAKIAVELEEALKAEKTAVEKNNQEVIKDARARRQQAEEKIKKLGQIPKGLRLMVWCCQNKEYDLVEFLLPKVILSELDAQIATDLIFCLFKLKKEGDGKSIYNQQTQNFLENLINECKNKMIKLQKRGYLALDSVTADLDLLTKMYPALYDVKAIGKAGIANLLRIFASAMSGAKLPADQKQIRSCLKYVMEQSTEAKGDRGHCIGCFQVFFFEDIEILDNSGWLHFFSRWQNTGIQEILTKALDNPQQKNKAIEIVLMLQGVNEFPIQEFDIHLTNPKNRKIISNMAQRNDPAVQIALFKNALRQEINAKARKDTEALKSARAEREGFEKTVRKMQSIPKDTGLITLGIQVGDYNLVEFLLNEDYFKGIDERTASDWFYALSAGDGLNDIQTNVQKMNFLEKLIDACIKNSIQILSAALVGEIFAAVDLVLTKKAYPSVLNFDQISMLGMQAILEAFNKAMAAASTDERKAQIHLSLAYVVAKTAPANPQWQVEISPCIQSLSFQDVEVLYEKGWLGKITRWQKIGLKDILTRATKELRQREKAQEIIDKYKESFSGE